MPKGGARTPQWMVEAEAEFLREIHERQRREDEQNAGKIGQDPNLPYHPILNPEPIPEPIRLTSTERPPAIDLTEYQKAVWYEAIRLIRDRKFSTRFALGVYYGRCEHWAGELVRAMREQEVFTRQELRQLIKSKHKGVTNK